MPKATQTGDGGKSKQDTCSRMTDDTDKKLDISDTTVNSSLYAAVLDYRGFRSYIRRTAMYARVRWIFNFFFIPWTYRPVLANRYTYNAVTLNHPIHYMVTCVTYLVPVKWYHGIAFCGLVVNKTWYTLYSSMEIMCSWNFKCTQCNFSYPKPNVINVLTTTAKGAKSAQKNEESLRLQWKSPRGKRSKSVHSVLLWRHQTYALCAIL